jgi:uncharacterized membrane protein HdeD (DUF308 family)
MAGQAFISPDGAPREEQTPSWAWWLLLLVALCTLAVGVLLLVSPHRTLSTLAVILGIYLLAVGALWIGVGIAVREARGTGLLRGALALIAGAIVIRHPSGSIAVLALAFGIFLMMAGVFEIVGAIEYAEGRAWRVLEGLVGLGAGILIVAWPEFGIYTFAVVLGIALIVRGVVEAWLAVAGLTLSHGEPHGTSTLSPA